MKVNPFGKHFSFFVLYLFPLGLDSYNQCKYQTDFVGKKKV